MTLPPSPHPAATMDFDTLVYQGSPLKALGTYKRDDGVEIGKLGGHLVVFSGPADPDLSGEFFTRETDFGVLSRRGSVVLPAFYQHGFDPHFGARSIGEAEVRFDEFGAWAEYQIELRTEYERHLYRMAEQGKMAQSSGAVGHLVERKPVGKSGWLKTWPLGEASLTPTPMEPRTSAVPVKSLFENREAAPALDARLQTIEQKLDALLDHAKAHKPEAERPEAGGTPAVQPAGEADEGDPGSSIDDPNALLLRTLTTISSLLAQS